MRPPEPIKPVVLLDQELRDLIPDYIRHRHQDIHDARTAIANHDLATLREIGHRIKGSGSWYGLDVLSGLGRSLEAAAIQNNLDESALFVQKLSDYLDNLEVQYH